MLKKSLIFRRHDRKRHVNANAPARNPRVMNDTASVLFLEDFNPFKHYEHGCGRGHPSKKNNEDQGKNQKQRGADTQNPSHQGVWKPTLHSGGNIFFGTIHGHVSHL